MSCGCKGYTPTTAARWVMCDNCPHLDRDTEECRVSEIPVSVAISANICPKGRFPNERGLVRWLGLRIWRGAPRPLQWRSMLRHRIRSRKGNAGCGCIDPIKRLWEKLK